jgi:hypothetical protein
MHRKSTTIPEPIAQLQRQLDQFRSTLSAAAKMGTNLAVEKEPGVGLRAG